MHVVSMGLDICTGVPRVCSPIICMSWICLRVSVPDCGWIGLTAGIDVFFGQQYTAEQVDRIFAMIANEGLDGIPGWARQLALLFGAGSSGKYTHDGDFGWRFRLEIAGGRIFGEHFSARDVAEDRLEYPFEMMTDDQQLNLVVRMRLRMASAKEYPLYVAKGDWSDEDQKYARSSAMFWGAQSKQYLTIAQGVQYYRICESDCDDPWWYMMPFEVRASSLTHGGWAPPTYFLSLEAVTTLHEVDEPVLSRQEVYYNVSLPSLSIVSGGLGGCQLYVDGSCNDRQGIVGGWVFVGQYLSGRASVAGAFTGSEASELLSIVGGVAHAAQVARNFAEIVCCVDSQNAYDHVFERKAPVCMDGKDLGPGITLARMLVDRLQRRGVSVVYRKIAREDNFAHSIAKHEQRRRYDGGWVSSDNWWPDCMDRKWLDVFRMVARNRQSVRKEYDLPAAVILGIGPEGV